MKKLLPLLACACALFASCQGPKDCYMCITVTSYNYTVTGVDTVIKCDFTSRDANEYQTAHTVNGKIGNYYPGTTTACNCQIPTK